VAMEALTRSGSDFSDRALAGLRQIAYLVGTPDYIREVAVDAAGAIDPSASAGWIDGLVSDASWRVRTGVVRALARRGPAGLVLLRFLVRDPDFRVAASALDALVESTAPTEVHTLRPLLLEMLQARDSHLRAAAVRGLGLLSDPAIYPVLLEAYDRARFDRESDAAVAAIDAISDLARRSGFAAERA